VQLQPIDDGIWLIEGGIVDFHGFPYPTRSVIVRLADATLWVWSPVALTPELKAAVDALGPVRHLVSPNKIHHLYLHDWHHAWPEAALWGPASTIVKRRDLTFQAPLDSDPPAAWGGEIDLVRFRGSPFMDEVVFFHRASRTAILADLSENFTQDFLQRHWRGWQRAIARVWQITEPWGLAPLEWRLSFFRRGPARAARARLLGWAPERVVMAHGAWQRRDGSAYLARAFAWLGPYPEDRRKDR